MKRSEINAALKEYRFAIPPFCHFTPEEWKEKGHDYDEIRDNMLGWDITDYGLGDFNKVGFSLITIRNGNLAMRDKYTKTYAEKLLYIKEVQYSPMHFHWTWIRRARCMFMWTAGKWWFRPGRRCGLRLGRASRFIRICTMILRWKREADRFS